MRSHIAAFFLLVPMAACSSGGGQPDAAPPDTEAGTDANMPKPDASMPALDASNADADAAIMGSTCNAQEAVCSVSNNGCNVGSYYLYDNQWNCGGNPCGPESAYGCDDGSSVSFVVASKQPKGNTAVLTYPAMQWNPSTAPALASLKSVTSTFDETSPHVGDYEVAYDCWFDNYANELMVWVDNYNQAPGGNKVATNLTLGGRSYDVWYSVGSSSYVAFVANTNFTSGTVDLLEIFNYAASKGWIHKTPQVTQLDFGIEVCSTNDTAATWTITGYTMIVQ